MAAITLKPIGDISSKWARRAAAAGPDYEAGVRSPKRSWASEAKASEPAYEAGVSDAVSRKAFGKGVTKAGDEKWSRKTLAVGPARYPSGVSAGAPDYQAEFGPYRDAIERVALPTKGRRGDPGNLERVRVIADALHNLRVGGR